MGRGKHDAHRRAASLLAQKAAFRSEYLDFERGIRVGHLEPQERITQIIKARLTERYGARMICDRWGRGVYWQWICWVPEPNRRSKPISASYNFASGKFFIAVDREERIFQCGMQIERAPRRPAEDDWPIRLEKDWDWHVLLRALRGDDLRRLLGRLLREGFRIRAGAFAALVEYDRKTWDADLCRRRLQRFAPAAWGGFQLFWPMKEREVRATGGAELVDAMMAVFAEVAPALDLCLYAPCLKEAPGGASSRS